MTMMLINGQADTTISAMDRGLQYGDGLFETIAFRQGKLILLEAHLQRLKQSCEVLHLPFDDDLLKAIETDIAALISDDSADAVYKVILTRGSGGRGYRAPENISVSRIVSRHPYPVYPQHYQHGVSVRICEQRLALNPQLAGIKHLNRLEQVLARSEWQSDDIAEGLMLDINGNLIEGTMTNIFLFRDQSLFTPAIDDAGIAGIMREYLIHTARQLGWPVLETQLSVHDLRTADECLLCNSVIGIWPITRLQSDAEKIWQHGPMTKKLQQSLSAQIMQL